MNNEQQNNTTQDRLASGLRGLGGMDPGADFASRVMERIGSALPLPLPKRRSERVLDWFVRPRTLRVSPLAGLAAAACLLLSMGLLLRLDFGVGSRAPEGLAPVTFVLAAPSAREVAVIGSFNGWNAAGWTMTRDPSRGLWTLSSALPPGSHEYVFLIDGTTPVADVTAALNVDDGFGGRNSVLLVKSGHGSIL
ncbi:hypothetical protein H4684_001147 [Desulfomicrobium macestii]|uniref:Glycogen recognition site of AMP-activated protein kinase n=2 Tax=Desulfomicrobium TaxID=898 RepID=A0A8G2C3W3_DESNO|nr:MULTISPECIES: glycogen-binding domain-containing protein [Desulfomicrobium]MBE1424515.1 hypothetical protein [Desulfomicrobium macestii]SFL87720.1 Glycogen recognition site of AMP-activated protein kinase [Desulfomicrobium norvegicum]